MPGTSQREPHGVAAFDTVELTEAVEGIPAGARGGVLELHEPHTAMVENMEQLTQLLDRLMTSLDGLNQGVDSLQQAVGPPARRAAWATGLPGRG